MLVALEFVVGLVLVGVDDGAGFDGIFDESFDGGSVGVLNDLGGADALQDKAPLPARIWNRIPDAVRERLITLALDRPELSPRELAVTLTDVGGYAVSESAVYRLLKAHDLITRPAFTGMKATNAFTDKTTALNQRWQTDFTYLKSMGWG